MPQYFKFENIGNGTIYKHILTHELILIPNKNIDGVFQRVTNIRIFEYILIFLDEYIHL